MMAIIEAMTVTMIEAMMTVGMIVMTSMMESMMVDIKRCLR
ncbi:MAG TPA: hypothetical protein VK946_06100 [Methylotenera sp.]|nr:hypothetical protein [Methylotenera sp.]